jgi:hypothetical protein
MLRYTYIAYLVYYSSSLYSVVCLGNRENIIVKDIKHHAIILDRLWKPNNLWGMTLRVPVKIRN